MGKVNYVLGKLVRRESKLPISKENMATKSNIRRNNLTPKYTAPDVYTDGVYRTPVPMEKVSAFGSHFISPAHQGGIRHAVDFYVPEGTEVRAPAAGTVIRFKEDSDAHGLTKRYWLLGNDILIKCSNGEYVSLEHLQHNFATKLGLGAGQRVGQGEIIGISGVTGYAEFPHVHTEVLKFVGNARSKASLANYKNYVTKKIRFSRKDIPFDLYREESR